MRYRQRDAERDRDVQISFSSSVVSTVEGRRYKAILVLVVAVEAKYRKPEYLIKLKEMPPVLRLIPPPLKESRSKAAMGSL